MKTILVDAVGGIIKLENGSIFRKLEELLDSYSNKKIVLTNAKKEKFKQYSLDKLSYDVFTLEHRIEKTNPEYYKNLLASYGLNVENVIYIEHNADAVKSAESVGINTYFYDHTKQDLEALKEFLDSNI
jgi:HAD superfamily hydrolase (TIGR01509 family)